jgi:uncharacterized protein
MPESPRDLLGRFQQATLDFSADSLADLFADEAVYEFVFWTPHRGPSQRYQGREEIRAGFAAAWGSVSKPPLTGLREVRVHETADAEVVICEGVHLRDYSDVLRTAAGLGRLPQLFEMVRADP